MFESMTVKSLKQLVSQYRQHHNIKGYSKMKKADLLTELDKRFVIHNNELFLKQNTPQKTQPPATPTNQKKRITPMLVSASPKKIPKQQTYQQPVQLSNAVKRALKKADELEEYYKNRGDQDEYPDLAF
jgi:hypothetical protein